MTNEQIDRFIEDHNELLRRTLKDKFHSKVLLRAYVSSLFFDDEPIDSEKGLYAYLTMKNRPKIKKEFVRLCNSGSGVINIPFEAVKNVPVKKDIDKVLERVTAKDFTRYALTGIYYDAENKFRVATDGHILIAVKDETLTKTKLAYTPSAIKSILSMNESVEEDMEKIREYIEKGIKLEDSPYPDYKSVFFQSSQSEFIRVNFQDLPYILGILEAAMNLEKLFESNDKRIITTFDNEIFFSPKILYTVLHSMAELGVTSISGYYLTFNKQVMFFDELNHKVMALAMPLRTTNNNKYIVPFIAGFQHEQKLPEWYLEELKPQSSTDIPLNKH